jgi:WD40 repeat protein/actin-like ATPase involved in cell morphogenesis
VPSWTLAIDFGTSYTVAAARIVDRAPEIVEIRGERRMPSVVMTDPSGRIYVGRTAEDLSVAHPGSTLRAVKDRLGDHTPTVLAGRPFQVVTLVAAILEAVYDEVVAQMGEPPSAVHLTHPAAWNQPRISRLVEAAAKAGLPKPLMVPEPVAAALSYAADVGLEPGRPILVYDLGGGTFDSAVITGHEFGFRIVGRPTGDQHIGGELFDELLVNHIGATLDPAVWDSIQVGEDPLWQQVAAALRNEARKAKEALSAHPYATALIPLPAGLHQVRLTQDEFTAMVEPYIAETVATVRRCLADADVRPEQLAGISLVGGSSRSPIVEEMVRAAFPMVPIRRRGDPKATVAAGATLAEPRGADGPGVWSNISTQPASPGTAPQRLRLAPPPLSDPPAGPTSQPSAPTITAPPIGPPAGLSTAGSDASGRPRRGRTGLVAAAVIAVAAVAAVAVLVSRGGDRPTTDAATTQPTPTSAAELPTTGPSTPLPTDAAPASTEGPATSSSDAAPEGTESPATSPDSTSPDESPPETSVGSDEPIGEELAQLNESSGALVTVMFSPDDRRVLSAGDDGTAIVWDVADDRHVLRLEGHTGAIRAAVFSPDGTKIATAGEDGTVRVWRADNGAALQVFEGHTDVVNDVRFSPDGGSLLTASDDATVRLWDLGKRQQSGQYLGPTDAVSFAEFSPNGRWIVAGGADGVVRVWSVNASDRPLELLGHTTPVRAGAFSPDGTLVAAGADDGSTKVWDAREGNLVYDLGFNEGGTLSTTFSHDGSRVMSTGADATAAVWDVATGTFLGDLHHDDIVVDAAFSPDDRTVVTASLDGTARLWDVSPGTPIGTPIETLGLGSPVRRAAFNSDGTIVATVVESGAVTLWRS